MKFLAVEAKRKVAEMKLNNRKAAKLNAGASTLVLEIKRLSTARFSAGSFGPKGVQFVSHILSTCHSTNCLALVLCLALGSRPE